MGFGHEFVIVVGGASAMARLLFLWRTKSASVFKQTTEQHPGHLTSRSEKCKICASSNKVACKQFGYELYTDVEVEGWQRSRLDFG